jgi:protein gp37
MSKRNLKVLGEWGPNGTRVIASESMWREPIKWNRDAEKAGERRRVFCASLADVFEGYATMPEASMGAVRDARDRLFDLILSTPHLDWLLLTKRPQNIKPLMQRIPVLKRDNVWDHLWPHHFPNVWLGTSVEDQKTADERIPHLRCPAAVRFLSVEPLLGPVDLTALRRRDGSWMRPLDGRFNTIDWVIVGGESGPGSRPCNVAWISSIVSQCKAAGVACFVKQLGSQVRQYSDLGYWPVRVEGDRPRLTDPKGGDPTEWPEFLRVREFPEVNKEQA